MLVSKNALSLIGVFAAEGKAGGQGAAQFAKPSEGLFLRAIAHHLELALPGDSDLDLVAFLEFERFDDSGGKADRQAVAPFRDLHVIASDDIHFLVYIMSKH